MSAARWIQCETAITEYGFLAKHPTTGSAIQIKYNLEGSERKALLEVMREILQDTPKYMGPPTFSFEVGPYGDITE